MAVATAAVEMRSSVRCWFGEVPGLSQEAISNAGFKSAREVPSEVLGAHFFFGANGTWSRYLGVLGELSVLLSWGSRPEVVGPTWGVRPV